MKHSAASYDATGQYVLLGDEESAVRSRHNSHCRNQTDPCGAVSKPECSSRCAGRTFSGQIGGTVGKTGRAAAVLRFLSRFPCGETRLLFIHQ